MRIFECRCVIQNKDGTDKYYPKVISANTIESFPWSVPLAEVKINTNVSGGTTGFMSPIRNDDIIRIQVNTKNNDSEKSIWQDIFEGRIMEIESEWGSNNLSTLICRGHSEETLYRAVTANYDPATSTTGTMLAALVGLYLSRLTDDSSIDTAGSTSIPSYNIQLDTKFMSDAIIEFEALEEYGYIFKILTNYDSDGNLDTNIVSWQPVPTLSSAIQIIEGTQRLLSATFSSSIKSVVEDVTIYGVSGTPQKVGVSQDGTPSYGTRFHINVDSSILSNQLCTDMADAIRSRFGSSITIGTVKIIGDANISVGDLIYCKIPSITLDGSSIDGNYRVKRMRHSITENDWDTSLELGELIESPNQILAGQHTKNRLLNANFID